MGSSVGTAVSRVLSVPNSSAASENLDSADWVAHVCCLRRTDSSRVGPAVVDVFVLGCATIVGKDTTAVVVWASVHFQCVKVSPCSLVFRVAALFEFGNLLGL